MKFASKKKLMAAGLAGAIIVVFTGCYLWLNCKNYCISIFNSSYELITAKLLIYSKNASIILLLFLIFKLFQKIFIDKLLRKLMQKLGTSERFSSFQKLVKFLLWTTFTIITLSVLIGNITAVVASLGLIGFGLTFALQKPILNLVGWLTILLKNIYSEGDRIKIGGVVGDVKEIQIMNTLLDGLLENSDVRSVKTISFPNELILTSEVVNYTKDSNYIVNELSISITYESNYKKAMSLLRKIIIHQVTVNKQKYIKKITRHKRDLTEVINKWIHSGQKSKKEEIEEIIAVEAIKKESDHIEQELKKLEEEFIPRIRIEMLDSSIQLIAQFKCPYNEIKKNRTEINIAFLDAIQNESDIEVAYPHIQLVNK
jgi:small-conductance mechanosensitive channel